jgi:S-adenosylmethionine uptake transporter
MKALARLMDRLDAPVGGIVLAFAGIFAFSLQDIAIKWISEGYPVHEIVFVRSLVAILPILLIAHLEGGLAALRTRRPWLQLLRACAAFMAYTFYYLALAALPLADTIALFFAAPLFVTALSVLLLGERAGLRRWLAVSTGFLGVVIMLRPGASVIDPAASLSVLAALSYSIAVITTRRLGRTDSGSSMVFYMTILYLAVTSVLGLAIGNGAFATGKHASLQFLLRAWVFPLWPDLGLMALCGLTASLGFYFTSQAYRMVQASIVAPFEYIAVPLGIVWGYVFWGDLPDAYVFMGMVLVVGSGLFLLRRESLPGRITKLC